MASNTGGISGSRADASSPSVSTKGFDPGRDDDAPELTPELAKRAQISIGGKVVRPATGTVTTQSETPTRRAWLDSSHGDGGGGC